MNQHNDAVKQKLEQEKALSNALDQSVKAIAQTAAMALVGLEKTFGVIIPKFDFEVRIDAKRTVRFGVSEKA